MKRLQHFVNLLFSRLTQHLHASFSEGANYSPALHARQGLFLPRIQLHDPGTAIAYMPTCTDH